jgi:hypothetical protein
MFKIFENLNEIDIVACSSISHLWNRSCQRYDASPKMIEPNHFEAKIVKNNERIYLRMELLTEENEEYWDYYKQSSIYMAYNHCRGVLVAMVTHAGTEGYSLSNVPGLEKTTGFNPEEFDAYIGRIIQAKKETDNKIVNVIKSNAGGSAHMETSYESGRLEFIAYATKNPNFSIKNVEIRSGFNLKNHITAFSDILISFGSDFSFSPDSFHSRGIFRNPHWIAQNKYGGLSMALHAMTGALAEKFFPEKTHMHVKPLGSMLYIMKQNLQRGDGDVCGEDITEVNVSRGDCEFGETFVKVSALSRLFYEAIFSS